MGGRGPRLGLSFSGFSGLGTTWTLQVGRIIALWAVLSGLGLQFYILLGFRD